MNPNSVGHFEIYADNPPSLADFYSKLFGWEIKEMPEIDYWWIQTIETNKEGSPTKPGAINGGMLKRPEGYNGHSWMNYVSVESIETAVRNAEELGAKLMKGKTAVQGMGWFAMLKDPQGNEFALWQSDKEAK